MPSAWAKLDAIDRSKIAVMLASTVLAPTVLKAWSGDASAWWLVMAFAWLSSLLWAVGAIRPLFDDRDVFGAAMANGYAALFAIAAASLGLTYPPQSGWWLRFGFPVLLGLPS